MKPASPEALGTRVGDSAPPSSLTAVRSLYVHIPFCERKCEYCDFTSVAGRRAEREYVAALCGELRALAEALPELELDTIFVGGGTPSFIDPALLACVMSEVRESFRIAPDAEATLEANPSSTSRERAAAWRAAGFNRVSLGVQSLDDECLRFLGRVHDSRRALDAVDDVRAAGFESINCDLIYAVPGLSDELWRTSLDRVIGAHPGHVSCYELTVEPGTPLHASVSRGRVRTVAAEKALQQHWLAVEALGTAGFRQYEVSNFATPRRECRHNLVYWRNGFYLAAGVGAHGHLPAAAAPSLGLEIDDDAVAVRYWHGRGVAAFVAAATASLLPIRGHESVTVSMRDQERIMLGLRLSEGVAIGDLRVGELVRDGLVALDGDRVHTTRRGQELLGQVVLDIAENSVAV